MAPPLQGESSSDTSDSSRGFDSKLPLAVDLDTNNKDVAVFFLICFCSSIKATIK